MLEQFTTECETVGMRISTSKSETMVLSQKSVEYPLQIGSEILPQVEEFKYLGVTNDGRRKQEIDGQIGVTSAVIWILYQSVVVKRVKPKGKALCLPKD